MGSSASKAGRSAASATRKYPTRVPPNPSAPNRSSAAEETAAFQRPAYNATARDQMPLTVPPKASGSRDEDPPRAAIERDAANPDLGLRARLTRIGPVQPSPTLSNSSVAKPASPQPSSSQHQQQQQQQQQQQRAFPLAAANPAISLLEARSRLAAEAEAEFEGLGRQGSAGRSFLDATTLRQVLSLRDERGVAPDDIERRMDLKRGTVGRLGREGVVSIP